MSESREELEAQLDGLRRAARSGALSVTYLGNGVTRKVEFRSYEDIMRAIADIEERLIGDRPRNIVVRGERGWSGAGGRNEHGERRGYFPDSWRRNE